MTVAETTSFIVGFFTGFLVGTVAVTGTVLLIAWMRG